MSVGLQRALALAVLGCGLSNAGCAEPEAVVHAPAPVVAAPEEREVTVGDRPALPGTLTMPRAPGPVPAIVLVHGSGPNDRDETILALKPFKDLASGLAAEGIAVLRYEKRTRHAPEGVITQKEEVLDAVDAAIALLRRTPGVDPKRVFVLGHSQGGYLAPRIAEAHPELAGVVVLAGSAKGLQDSIVDQLEFLSKASPDNADLPKLLVRARDFKAKVESPTLTAEEDVKLPFGGSAKGAYFLDVRDYRPEVTARKVAMPLLVLQGERDYQVTMAEHAIWRDALKGKPNATTKAYPGLNHLFVRGEGPPTPAEYAKPGHVDPAVIHDIASWIHAKR